jgi:hypothetical protein
MLELHIFTLCVYKRNKIAQIVINLKASCNYIYTNREREIVVHIFIAFEGKFCAMKTCTLRRRKTLYGKRYRRIWQKPYSYILKEVM